MIRKCVRKQTLVVWVSLHDQFSCPPEEVEDWDYLGGRAVMLQPI